MTSSGRISERAIVFAPNGRDAKVAVLILREAGFTARSTPNLASLVDELQAGAGLAIIADEAIRNADLRTLADTLTQQPPWSDFPIILLTQRGGGPERNPDAARLAQTLGNVTFLERPFHPTTLISVVRTAIRGRRRQYDARTQLEELSKERAALSALTATLEKRVSDRTAELMKEVSARETAQARLLQSQKMETVGQLTGGVAHDFNNLLMAVMGNLELLRKRLTHDARAQRLIAGALQGAQRGAALTQRMLAFARQQELKTTPIDLSGLLSGMRDLLERALGPQIVLVMDTPLGLPPAQIDANQIELAVLNLAINARDAMPKGGEIRITLRHGDLEKGKDTQRGYLLLSVADTGTGMNPETLAKAIEPFFSTKPVGKGTGLGLSMVHGLAIQLGGHLHLESAVGKGTTATLQLPIATQKAPAAEVRSGEAQVSFRAATILVVDDDQLIASSTVDMLEDLGHTVIEANSAQRALEILDNGHPVDLMITDQAMPGMTGIELAEVVLRRLPNLPILLATGYADLPVVQSLKIPRLSKPYLQSQLQLQIDRLLSR